MFKPITIVLDGVPRGKGRPRFDPRTMRPYKDPKTEDYEKALGWKAREAMRGRQPVHGPLDIIMIAKFPIPKDFNAAQRRDAIVGLLRPLSKPDADNIAKMKDALNKIVWTDDALVVDETVRKFFALEPSLLIQVRPAVLGVMP